MAVHADEVGFAANWFAESDQADAIGLMHAAAIMTSRAAVGSGVIPIQTRPPALVAMGCANLTHLAPGRVRIGIGHSSPNVVAKWGGREFVPEDAVGQVAEFTAALRACLSGERTKFLGRWFDIDGFRLRLAPESRVSVIVAALGDFMAQAVGDYADGVLMSYITPERLSHLAPKIRKRVRDADRDSDEFRLCVMLNLSITDRPDEAAAAFRRVLVSYSTVDAYASVFGEAGFAKQVADVRQLWGAGDRVGALDAVDLEMVNGLAAFGDADTVRARVTDLLAAGADEVAVGLIEAPGSLVAEDMISELAEIT